MGQLVDRDEEHLRLLMWAYYIWGGTIGFFSLFAVIYIGFGAMMAFGGFPASNNPANDPRLPGLLLLVGGSVFFILGVTFALLTFFAGRSIRDRRRRIFCQIIGGLNCLQVPFGTVMGVCSILVLNRPQVKLLFDSPGAPPPPAPVPANL
jgi:hypothetical protein